MSDCQNQWKLDVNDRYGRGVGIVISLASASLVLPLLFLKDVAKISDTLSFSNSLSFWAYFGWVLLSMSVLSGIAYYFCSAKWVKLAWGKEADIFGTKVTELTVEKLLDGSYFLMMTGFVLGLASMITYIVTFTNGV